MAGSGPGVLLDLDQTLVLTESLEPLRRRRAWPAVYAGFPSTSLPPGTLAFVAELAGIGPAGVVTSSPRAYAERLLRHYGIEIPVLVAYHDTERHKPHPDPLLEAARRLGLSPARCAHIGDAPGDEEAARAAGMAPLQVSWEAPTVGACRTWDEVLARLRDMARQWALAGTTR